jgi:hypothetical protein
MSVRPVNRGISLLAQSASNVCLPQEEPIIKLSWFADTRPARILAVKLPSDSVTNITSKMALRPLTRRPAEHYALEKRGQFVPPTADVNALPVEFTIIFCAAPKPTANQVTVWKKTCTSVQIARANFANCAAIYARSPIQSRTGSLVL